jgi:hypothetical protein
MDSHISEIFGNDRRRMSRRQVRLPVSVSLIETDAPADAVHRPLAVLGYTRDISVDGLALILPSISMGGDITDRENYMLRIILALPVGDVEMNAIAVRHERLDTNSPDIGYLIGARISEMSERERDLYLEYLRILGGD